METRRTQINDAREGQESGTEDRHGVLYRLARPTDAAAIGAMGGRCSEKSLAQRFHPKIPGLPRGFVDSVVARADERINVIAIDRTHERVVGIGSWCETEPRSGEIGLLVEDEYQSGVIGTQLLRRLVWAACARPSMTFEAGRSAPTRRTCPPAGRTGRGPSAARPSRGGHRSACHHPPAHATAGIERGERKGRPLSYPETSPWGPFLDPFASRGRSLTPGQADRFSCSLTTCHPDVTPTRNGPACAMTAGRWPRGRGRQRVRFGSVSG
jgi:hypothetical protein